ncbi:MAG TPA: methionyl-tRNA formyltransferase [Acidimicrobiales bacterium]|nr:methionyl-tRNA formyltransferase [Acidimicrobiales bacterium]
MRLAFLGTPDAAVPTLDAIVRAGHDVKIVVTRPDRRRGRGGEATPSPVKIRSQELGLVVSHELRDVLSADVERGVVVAYGALVPEDVLARVPMLNVHFSLLPRWRGAAPVERAILAGDAETGVAVMGMEAGLDTGPIHLERRVAIGQRDARALRRELAVLGAEAVVEVLDSATLLDHARAQEGEAVYAHKITRADRQLDPRESVEMFLRRTRVGAAELRVDGHRLFVERAQIASVSLEEARADLLEGSLFVGCSQGSARLDVVRPEGGGSMAGAAWWRGRLRERRHVAWSSTHS